MFLSPEDALEELDNDETFFCNCAPKHRRPAFGAPVVDHHGTTHTPFASGTTSLDYHDQDDETDLPDEPPPGWADV